MTKLTVTYYPDKSVAKLAARFHDGNGYPGDAISIAYGSQVKYDFPFDVDEYDFRGTVEQLFDSIMNAIENKEISYSAIGQLFIILDHFPKDYNYVIITNQ